ncbi:beta strand repeat-containing protein [Lactococcus kimchii]|uniref:beta strand repeat-containing protein n=1 Tax=Lactococcus sp. S-13 TaxID=2507158 RepID=UPI0010231B52|nr:hypothetical protein [Lactococcus sp. S-13]RZI48587.1 hypothetical protein EQJ87_03455 [Lactococcus sp. S-13]
MANLKHLLKKSINIGSSALLLVSTMLPTLGILPAQDVKAATLGGQALTSGGTFDTGAHNWSDTTLSSAINNTASWNSLGTTQIAGNWFNLTQNAKNQAGYAIFKAAMDMSNTTSISGVFRTQIINPIVGQDYTMAGDAVGFLLTPSTTAQINTNSSTPSKNTRPVNFPTGAGLGIGGLQGSVFAGRDLYYNASSGLLDDATQDIDGIDQWFGQSPGPIYASVIRTTYDYASKSIVTNDSRTLLDQAAGNLIPDATGTYNNGSTYPISKWQGSSYLGAGLNGIIPYTKQTEDEQVTMTWTPDSPGTTAAKISGTLTYYAQALNSDGSVNTGAGSATVTQKLTLPRSMSIGAFGGTGNNYGNISFSNNTSKITGNRGTAPVQVNYINSVTKQKVASYTSSTITANVGDRISLSQPGGVTASQGGVPGLYTFSAPTIPAGYNQTWSAANGNKVTYGGSFNSSGVLTGDSATDPNNDVTTGTASTQYLTVANYDSSNPNPNPNQINVYYVPTAQSAWFAYGHAFNTQSTAANLTTYPATPAGQTGVTGTAITAPTTIQALPAGYHYAGVKYYDSKAAQNRVFWTTSALGWTSPTANTAPSTSTAGYYTGYSDISAAMAAAIKDANAENGGMIPVSLTSQPANELAGFGSGTPNVFLMYYEADKITANFTFNYASGSTGPALPSTSSVSGAYTTAITGAPTYTAPTGYTTSVVVTANGTTLGTYSSLAAALSANAKYTGTTASGMTFATTVSANQNKVNFTYQWAKGTPGATDSGATTANPGKLQGNLPTNSTLTAGTGASLTSMPANWLPTGYGVQSVATPDGNTYTSFTYSGTTITLTGKDASGNTVTKTGTAASAPSDLYLATRAVFPTVTSAATQNWVIILNALTQKPTLRANFTGAGITLTPPDSFTISFQSDANGTVWTGLTGAPIPSSVVTATENALKAKILAGGTTYQNWYLAHYADPNGNFDTNATTVALANVVALAGGNLLATPSNNYSAQYDYEGVVSFSVPSNIDFGTHFITGSTQNLTGEMEDSDHKSQDVVVNDARAVPTGGTLSWTLTVAQTKAITSTSVLGLSFGDTMLSFRGTPMTLNTPITAGSDSNSTTGKLTTVVTSEEGAFKLTAPNSLQVPNANYQGQVTWTLTSAP